MNKQLLQILPPQENLYPVQLEQQYPHITNKLVELWGSTQLKPYLDSIMFDERGARAGFPIEVGDEISKIYAYVLKISPANRPAGDTDYWHWIS